MNSFIIFIALVAYCAADDLYTSTEELVKLIDTENHIIESLDKTIKKLGFLQEKIENFRAKFVHHENATEEYTLKYVANPLNSFALIKRLTIDLGELNRIHNETFDDINKEVFQNPEKTYATTEDLAGIARLLKELQIGYDQNITEFTNGLINGVKYGEPLTAGEVYHLEKAMCMDEAHAICTNWLKESLRKWNNDEDVSKVQIMEEISKVFHSLDNTNASLEWDNRILKEDPDHIDTLLRKAQNLKDLTAGKNMEEKDPIDDMHSWEKFSAICNGSYKLPENITSSFHCYYKYGESPFLRIAPFKVEEVYTNPQVLLVHDMVFDDEIEQLKQMAKPILERSGVSEAAGPKAAPYRISSTAFLWYLIDDNPLPNKILQRNLDLTGLVWSDRSLDIQITNYPPGGHYLPHYDMKLSSNPLRFDTGNRVVTVLHYLSEVEEGGGTALVHLGLLVNPIKGSAVYWRNLHSSGEPDGRTLHGGCPILHGIKWVSNVWIHMDDQEAATPCGLEYISEDYRDTLIGDL